MENENLKPWYKKKRYIIPMALLGLIVVLGLNNSSSQQQPQPASATVSSYENSVQTVQPAAAPRTTENLSNDNHYTNVDGNSVHSPAYSNSVPQGATARCRDGTYSFSQNRRGTCSHHGGVAEWL